MTELRLQIEDQFLDALQVDLRSTAKASELVRGALSLYAWAAQERASGRVILSAEHDLTKMTRLAMPALDNAEPPVLRRMRAERAAEAAKAASAAEVAKAAPAAGATEAGRTSDAAD